MTSPSAPPKPKSLMERIKELAEKGYGWEDCLEKEKMAITPENREFVRDIVIHGEKK